MPNQRRVKFRKLVDGPNRQRFTRPRLDCDRIDNSNACWIQLEYVDEASVSELFYCSRFRAVKPKLPITLHKRTYGQPVDKDLHTYRRGKKTGTVPNIKTHFQMR